MRRIVVPVLAVLLLLTGCAGHSPEVTPRTGTASPNATSGPGAIALINLWRVTGADGESVDTWLRLDAGELQLWRACGMIDGSWRATDTLFVASLFGSSAGCATGQIPDVPWLSSVATYQRQDSGWRLLDAAGTVVAELAVDGAPQPIPTAAEFYAEPPVITDAKRAAVAAPAPQAGSFTPATADSVIGRWTPLGKALPTDPHVQFVGDGTWSGSDGCNGQSGRWVIGTAGEILVTSGGSTLIGCEGAQVPGWVVMAARAGFDHEALVLFDIAGAELGRLQRA